MDKRKMIDLCLVLGILFVVIGMFMNVKAQKKVNVEIVKSDMIQDGEEGKININTAGLAELDSLPGIGVVTAQKIIDYRLSNGNFKSVEEIKKISGIGPKKYADIVAKISI